MVRQSHEPTSQINNSLYVKEYDSKFNFPNLETWKVDVKICVNLKNNPTLLLIYFFL